VLNKLKISNPVVCILVLVALCLMSACASSPPSSGRSAPEQCIYKAKKPRNMSLTDYKVYLDKKCLTDH